MRDGHEQLQGVLSTIKFHQADNFAVAYYAGGAKEPQPLTFPFDPKTAAVPEPPARADLRGARVGGSVVALMTYAAVLEKRGDYVLLAAIGAGSGVRFLVVMQQALLAALAGALAGLTLLLALERLLPALVPEIEFRLELWIAAAALAGSLGMAALGALFPARLATRLPPLEALRR